MARVLVCASLRTGLCLIGCGPHCVLCPCRAGPLYSAHPLQQPYPNMLAHAPYMAMGPMATAHMGGAHPPPPPPPPPAAFPLSHMMHPGMDPGLMHALSSGGPAYMMPAVSRPPAAHAAMAYPTHPQVRCQGGAAFWRGGRCAAGGAHLVSASCALRMTNAHAYKHTHMRTYTHKSICAHKCMLDQQLHIYT